MTKTSQSQEQLHYHSPDSMPDLDGNAVLLDDMDLEHELEELVAEVADALPVVLHLLKSCAGVMSV